MGRRRSTGGDLVWTIVFSACLAPYVTDASGAEPRKPFSVADRLDLWQAQRADTRKTALHALGLADVYARPAGFVLRPGRVVKTSDLVVNQGRLEPRGGLLIEPITALAGSLREIRFVVFRPDSARPGDRLPAVLFLVDKWVSAMDNVDEGGLDWHNIEPAYLAPALAQRGYIVLVPVIRPLTSEPWLSREKGLGDGANWEETLRDDKLLMDVLLARNDVDPKRVGVAGIGLSGMRAWWLMAFDERISCGVAIGGITRLSDRLSAGGQARRPLAPWAEALLKAFDTEAVMTLCAPRRLEILNGDRDPLAPVSGFKVFRETVGKAYSHYKEGGKFTPTLCEGSGGELTQKKWESLVKTFDKQFTPRRP